MFIKKLWGPVYNLQIYVPYLPGQYKILITFQYFQINEQFPSEMGLQ